MGMSESIYDLLDAGKKIYVYNQKVVDSYSRRYNHVGEEERLMMYVNGSLGAYSDAFIMYAIAHMGVATKESISGFLYALSQKEKQLSIVSENSKDVLWNRIRQLCRAGLLFTHMYEVGDANVALYAVTDVAFTIMRQRLQKVSMSVNLAFQYKPLHELIGWACAANVGSILANHVEFSCYLERVLRTKQISSAFLPFEMKAKNKATGGDYYIATLDAFLYQDPLMNTQEDYDDKVLYKLNVIKNYVRVRSVKPGDESYVVVVVRDMADLIAICDFMQNYDHFNDLYSRIYFTGEGILKKLGSDDAGIGSCFLRKELVCSTRESSRVDGLHPGEVAYRKKMKVDDKVRGAFYDYYAYDLVFDKPPFLK